MGPQSFDRICRQINYSSGERTYTDQNVSAGATYRYRVRSNDQGPRSRWTQSVMTEPKPEPEPAERTNRAVLRAPVTLVSNTGQGQQGGGHQVGNSSANLRISEAVKVSAGSGTDGFTITELRVHLSSIGASAIPKVSIYTSSSDLPGTLVFTFTNPGSFAPGFNTFTAPANSTISGSTDYFVVFENTATGNTTADIYYVVTTSTASG